MFWQKKSITHIIFSCYNYLLNYMKFFFFFFKFDYLWWPAIGAQKRQFQCLTRPIFDSIFTAIIVHYCAKLCRAARYEPYCDHETSLIAEAFYEILKTKTTAPRIYRVVIKGHDDLWLPRFIRRYSRSSYSFRESVRDISLVHYVLFIFSFWTLLDLHLHKFYARLLFLF